VSWGLRHARQACKDARELAAAGPRPQAQVLLAILAAVPFTSSPPFEKPVGDL
jgi:hypothetical protein